MNNYQKHLKKVDTAAERVKLRIKMKKPKEGDGDD